MKLSILTTLCAASLLLLSGCVSSVPKPAEKPVIDSTLPVVSLTKNGIIRDMKTIAFEWKSIQDPRVNAIYIYKQDLSNKESKKLTYFKTINNRFQTHFVDNTNQTGTRYKYAFKVASKNAEGQLSQIYKVSTLPVLQSVTWIHSIAGMPRMAKIIWRPDSSERVNRYIIERKTFEDKKWQEIDRLEGRLNAEYIDQNLEDSHIYLYRIRVETFDGIVSTPSEIVQAVTKALPRSITQIHTTRNLPKKILITWKKSELKDFKRYYLYRAESNDGRYELIAKLYNNTFTDKIDKDGKAYFYRVSVVDKDNLESEHAKNSVMGMTLVKPLAPNVVEAKLLNGSVKLTWNKNDARIKYYMIIRKHREGWFKEDVKKINHIQTNSFIDKDIKPGSTYNYVIYGVDKNSIVSQPSVDVNIVTAESNKIIDAPADKEIEKSVKMQVEKEKMPTQTQDVIMPSQDLDLNEL
ncbi:fibronectin type III domain-containing protein [Sulfurimonas sp.]